MSHIERKGEAILGSCVPERLALSHIFHLGIRHVWVAFLSKQRLGQGGGSGGGGVVVMVMVSLTVAVVLVVGVVFS